MKRPGLGLISPLIAATLINTKGFHGGRYVPQLPRVKPDEVAKLADAEAKRQRKRAACLKTKSMGANMDVSNPAGLSHCGRPERASLRTDVARSGRRASGGQFQV